jgi:hypothetical protein
LFTGGDGDDVEYFDKYANFEMDFSIPGYVLKHEMMYNINIFIYTPIKTFKEINFFKLQTYFGILDSVFIYFNFYFRYL